MAAPELLADHVQPSSALLVSVLAALRRRHKALKDRVRELRVERIVDHSEDSQVEKLEIECVASGRTKMRLFVWEDRWVWADFRRISKRDGWLWAFTVEGRIFGVDPARQLLEALENSIGEAFEMTTGELDRFERIWAPLLAQGPRGVPYGK